MKVEDLRCEYLRNPLGIDVPQPRLNWWVTAGDRNQKQTANQVLVASTPELLAQDQGDLWNSGRVDSDQSIQVEYAGKALLSRTRCHWKVRVWDKDGKASAWSQPAKWSMGLLKPEDWQAKWTKPVQFPASTVSMVAPGSGSRRRAVSTGRCRALSISCAPAAASDAVVRRASVVLCAVKSFVLFVNGKEALNGDDWQVPRKTEISGLLKAGENILAVEASNADIGPNWAGWIGRVTVEPPSRGDHHLATIMDRRRVPAPGRRPSQNAPCPSRRRSSRRPPTS